MLELGKHYRRLDAIRYAVLAAFIGLAAMASGDATFAQTKPASEELHEFILVKIVPGKRADFVNFIEEKYFHLQSEDENLIAIKYYMEDRGLEWDLIVQLTYRDYEAAGESQQRFRELLLKAYPDAAERAAFISKFQGFVDRHQHMFYRLMPALTK